MKRDAKRMEKALLHLATYEKKPPEILKDDFAYDRLLDYIHKVAQVGLGLRDSTE